MTAAITYISTARGRRRPKLMKYQSVMRPRFLFVLKTHFLSIPISFAVIDDLHPDP
jgi:hypothetical protein